VFNPENKKEFLSGTSANIHLFANTASLSASRMSAASSGPIDSSGSMRDIPYEPPSEEGWPLLYVLDMEGTSAVGIPSMVQ
jgi:hypothetical protein